MPARRMTRVDLALNPNPQPQLSAATRTRRQRLGDAIVGDSQPGSWRRWLADGLVGGQNDDMGILDFTPAGALFLDESARKVATPGQRGQGAAELGMAILPIPASRSMSGIVRAAERGAEKGMMRRVAHATYEATPGVMTGHLPGISSGSPEVRAAYAADPRSTWAGPNGQDSIYSALDAAPGRTLPATGVYTPPGGLREVNPAQVAKPHMAVEPGPRGPQLTDDARQTLNSGEAARAYLDAQGAGAWHMPVTDAPADAAGSVFVPHEGPLSLDQIDALHSAGEPHGLGDVVDTGEGATMTTFYPNQPERPAGQVLDQGLGDQVRTAVPGAQPRPARVDAEAGDTGYLGYEDAWRQGEGSGAVTRQLQAYMSPEAVDRLDADPSIRQAALDRLDRDQELAAPDNPVRGDVQNARRIVAQSGFKGLFDALQKGAVLPATALAVVSAAQPQAQGQTPPPR